MKKPTVDTPYAGSYAQTRQDRQESTVLIDPRTLPVQFQEEQRLRNIRILMGTAGSSPELAEWARKEELKKFPK